MRLVNIFIVLVFFFSFAQVRGQSRFEEIQKREVMDCVFDFVAVRETFKDYGCMCRMQSQRLTQGSSVQSSSETIVFEDSKGRRRTDVNMFNLVESGDGGPNSASQLPVWSTFFENDRKRFFENGNEIDAGEAHGLGQFHFVADPWMATITEGELVSLAKGGEANYWTKVLDESNLLWGEENEQFVRGEWVFGAGDGKIYVQVYFQKEHRSLPVRVRYVLPHDWNQRFSEKGRVVSDTEIDWQELGDGFVPISIRFQRQDLWVSKPGVKISRLRSTDLFWDTKLRDKDGLIQDDVFVPNKLTFEEVKSSFVIRPAKQPARK